MIWVKAFLAGFLATLIFHQGVMALFWLSGLVEQAPWNFSPVPPLGVPAVLSLAFWGGVWGLPLWWLIRRWQKIRYWLMALITGAVAPTAVAMLVVFPLKQLDVTVQVIGGGLIVNGAWGIGVALIMVLLRGRTS